MAESPPPGRIGLLGGGVIGGGWAARFLLHGSDVRLYDPDPAASETVAEVVDDARRAYRRLTMAPLPEEGRLTIVATPEAAAEGAEFVQESAPERELLKRELLARAGRAAPAATVFASSTSGIRPSLLQPDMPDPGRLVVGHPFNPVYLLPLVEVCPGAETAAEAVERAADVYRSIGMRPLVMRREIDGFVADRLQEALWREALWLVNDGIATVSEVDDSIRFGPGLRWSFMGTYLTYRIGGGARGMRHFLEQFGPALEWPWTKLTDVPDLSAELIERIVEQSDEQAEGRSARELARIRDDCLVAVLQALRSQDAGAGAVLAAHERVLAGRGRGDAAGDLDEDGDRGGPLRVLRARVLPEWVDYNGHMHESRYLQLFGDASDALFARLGIDAAYLDSAGSYFTAETHLRHLREATADQRLSVTTQLLGYDEKRLHLFHRLVRDGEEDRPLATAEQMYLHVDAASGRAGPARADVLGRVAELAAAHAALDRPDAAGRSIAMPSA